MSFARTPPRSRPARELARPLYAAAARPLTR
jgi:hypothetical protein